MQKAAQQNCSMHSRAQIGIIECLASAHCNGGMACERAPHIKMILNANIYSLKTAAIHGYLVEP